jgi:hypothetical protein
MLLIVVYTAIRSYAVKREDVTQMRALSTPEDLASLGTAERPPIPIDLGTLLDPNDRSTALRRHGLVVPLRRRPIVFYVDRIDTAIEQAVIQPLPPMLAGHLRDSWSAGVLDHAGKLMIVIDLRAVARSVLAQRTVSG